jgi:hypothetical protein
MKALQHIENLQRCLESIKEAVDYFDIAKKKEASQGESFNASGCYIPTPYESAISSIYILKQEIYKLCEREFIISKILIDNAERLAEENDY